MQLTILTVNDTDRTITVSIDGMVYEYWTKDGDFKQLVSKLKKFIVVGACGRALNLLKGRSYKFDKISRGN